MRVVVVVGGSFNKETGDEIAKKKFSGGGCGRKAILDRSFLEPWLESR